MPQGEGGTLRDHLEQVEKSTGGRVRPPELDLPDLPDPVAHVWEWFADLHRARGSNGFGPNPLTYSEMAAWARLTGADPGPWEVALLKHLDGVYLDIQAKAPKPVRSAKP